MSAHVESIRLGFGYKEVAASKGRQRGPRLRILLVGGFGFIGRHLVRNLGESHSVVVFSDQEGVQKAAEFQAKQAVITEIGDIRDETIVREVMLRRRPESVVHLAALTGIKRCNENPALAFSVNVLGTYNVIMGCVACGSKLVFVSSREVYGETRSDRSREDDPPAPNNVYGVTKMLAEGLVTWAASMYDLDYTVLRLTNVYGPGGDQYNVQAMITKALSDAKIEISGGTQVMNLVYVEDVAEAVRVCLTDPRSSKQTFNVGSDDTMTVDEIVSSTATCLGTPIEVSRVPMRSGETLAFRPDLGKLSTTLGCRCPTTFAVGLQKTVKWYRERAGV